MIKHSKCRKDKATAYSLFTINYQYQCFETTTPQCIFHETSAYS